MTEQACYRCMNLFLFPDETPLGYKVRCVPNAYPGPERDVPQSRQCDCGRFRDVNGELGDAE